MKSKKTLIEPLYTCVLPSLKDSWMSGITDGDGCFTCSLLSNSTGYRFRYILTQKWDANKPVLEYITNLFAELSAKGSVVAHSVNNVWDIRINGVKNCKGLFAYFDEYNLTTKKFYSYSKWKIIHSRASPLLAWDEPKQARLIKGDHLNKVTRQELVALSKQVNKNI